MVVPQPDVVTRIASRPPFSISLVHTSMFVARLRERLGFAAHVMDQRAAASLAGRQHHLDAMAGQQPDRRLVDRRREHRLRTALQQNDAALARNFGREGLSGGTPRQPRRRQRQRRGNAGEESTNPLPDRNRLSARSRRRSKERRDAPRQPGRRKRRAEPGRIGQHRRQHGADQPVRPAAARRSPRCAPARDRRGACSARPTGRSSCRQGTRGSGRCA